MLLILMLFTFVSLAGLYMAATMLRGEKFPTFVPVFHGLLAAAGLILLLRHALRPGSSSASHWVLALFLLAAIGGLIAISYDWRQKKMPNAVIWAHALAAFVACAVLAITIFF